MTANCRGGRMNGHLRRHGLLTGALSRGAALINALRCAGSRICVKAQGAGAMVAFAALFASGAEAAKLTSTERTKIQELRPADVPSDEVLEAQGAVIGKIELDVRQIINDSCTAAIPFRGPIQRTPPSGNRA